MATTTFTDGAVRVRTDGAGSNQATIDWELYSAANCTGSLLNSGSVAAATGGNGSDIGPGTASPQSMRLTAQLIAGHAFTGWTNGNFVAVSANPACLNHNNGTQNTRANFVALAVRNTSTAIARTTGSNPSTYGNVLTFTATVTATGGNPSGVGTVTFKSGSVVLCSAVNLIGNTAACSPTLNVGAHMVTAEYSGAVAGTVQFNTSTSGALAQSITPKAVTVTPNSGQSKVYGTAEPILTYALSEIIAVTGELARDPGEDVDIYPITLGTLAASSSNYSLVLAATPVTFAITERELTITAADQTKTYGDTFTFDTASPSDDFDVVGLVNTDTVTSVTLSSTGAAATATVAGSPYVIVIGGALGSGLANYDIELRQRRARGRPKAELTITAADQTKTYGDTFTFDTTSPSDHFDVVGLVNTDTVTSVTLSSTGAAATRHRRRQPVRRSSSAARWAAASPTTTSTYVERRADGRSQGRADDHRRRPDQDVRRRVHVRHHQPVRRLRRGRPGQHRHGHQRDPQQHRRRGHRHRRRQPLRRSSSAGPSAAASPTTTSTYDNGELTVDPKAADDHRRRPDQDVRRRVHVRHHQPVRRLRRGRPGQHRHGHQRDPQQHRRRGHRHRRRQPVRRSSSAARWAAASPTTTSATTTATLDGRSQGRADDHRRGPDQDVRRHVHVRHHQPVRRLRRGRPGQRRHGHQRDPQQHRRRGHRHRRRQPVRRSSSAARWAAASPTTTSTYVNGELDGRSQGRADDHAPPTRPRRTATRSRSTPPARPTTSTWSAWSTPTRSPA